MTLYQAGSISVDHDFARFGAKSYAINKINTVEVREEPPKVGWAYFFGIVGVLILLTNLSEFDATATIIGAIFCGIAYLIVRNAKPTFRLFLMTSSSEVQAFETQDEDQVMALRNAVETAMVADNRAQA